MNSDRLSDCSYAAFEDGAYKDEPLILLVDGKTASASEILSSALQVRRWSLSAAECRWSLLMASASSDGH